MAALVVLCVVLILIAGRILKSNGISYERLSFQFPSTVGVEGLSISKTSLDIKAGFVHANWSWRALIKGDIRSNGLAVRDAVVRIKPSTDTGDTATQVPIIDVRRATLENVRLIFETGNDSSVVLLKDVVATRLLYNGKISIDSLINRNSEFTGVYSAAKSDHNSQDSTASFSIQSIPEFTVQHFEFSDCDFDVNYGEHHYAVNNFYLLFSGLNNHDIMDMTLQRLAFRYQDTVDVDLELRNAKLDNQNRAQVNNIFLEIPGLRIDAPQLTLSGANGFGLSTKLDSSYVDTDLLNFLFPSLRKWIPGGTRANIDGGVDYRAGQLLLDNTTLALGNDGTVSATGRLQFGSAGDSLKLTIHNLESSLYGLSKWTGLDVPSNQRNFPIHGQLHADGTYSHIRSDGRLRLQNEQLRYRAQVDQSSNGTVIEFGLESPSLEPQKIISQFENDLKLTGLSLKGSTIIGQNGLKSLHAELRTDSVFLSQRWYDAPAVVATYSHTHTVARFRSGDYSASINISGDVLTGDPINCAGNVGLRILQADGSAYAGHLSTYFHGIVKPRDPAADLFFDTLKFVTPENRSYVTKAKLKVARQPDQSFTASMTLEEYATLDALIGSDVLDWLGSDDKLSRFPTANVSMSLHADTTLVKAIAGIPARIEIEELNIISSPDDIKINFSSDTLYWQSFHTHQLVGNIEYHPGALTAKIETPELITPFTYFDSVKFAVTTHHDSAYTASLSTYLPEIDRGLGLKYNITSLPDGFNVAFADTALLLGMNRWHTNQNGSLFVSRSFEEFTGELEIDHQSQRAILKGMGNELLWKLENLDLFPITQTIAADPPIHGLLSASVSSNFKEGIFRWNGSLTGTSVDTVSFGNFIYNGSVTQDSLSLFGQLENDDYEVVGRMNKSKEAPAQFDIKVSNVDLHKFSSLIPVPASTLTLNGILNADVKGSYGEKLLMRGYVSLPNTEIISSEYDLYLKSDKDSLLLNGTTATLDQFVFRDRYGNPLTIHGTANLPGQTLDITIKSDRFRILDRTQKKSTLTGEVDLATNIRVHGQKGDYKVSGKIGTLDGAALTYLYKSTVTLDDRQREMEFVSFTQQEEAVRVRPKRRRHKKPLEWDVTFDVGKIDVTVLFSAVNQDHVKTTASGKVSLTTGSSAEPTAYGLIESNSGNISYHVPMVSDLRMIISKAGIRWVGEVAKPLLSFNGSQTFRITPNEISSLWTNKTDKWPISVIAKVNDRPLNDLVLDFDLSSTNNQVSDWISSLAPETREAYAVSLLLRGRINTGGTADVNLLTEAMVSKMNEISSRNIKSADVSFYDESRGPNSPDGSTNKIGYSISKGLANKKMRIIVGGSVDLTGKADPSMTDVKVEYVLREDPTITLRAGKANVYTGVIDGNVDESSFGFTYIKRFRNLFNSHKKRTKE
ncbi:translocation/assembly module TamB domain-containing protein [Chryseolinea sp. T2]|uniref:translocation/assembly module TamB domain-containing protein n=1 Tax=Chryseolinea sp. T2 TaxID=3129255 RepID=UPI00307730EB